MVAYEPKVVVTTICQALNAYLETFQDGSDPIGTIEDERYKIAYELHDFMVCVWEDLHRHDVDDDDDYQR